MEEKSTKLFYSIGEVAQTLGESISLIRFWSDSFPELIVPGRNKKGNRIFTKEDVETFRLLHYLIKVRRMTLDGARQYVLENKAELNRNMDIIGELENIKAKLNRVLEEL